MTAAPPSERPAAVEHVSGPRAGWFAGLDGLRFVAAFAVLVHHAGFSSGLTIRTDTPGMFLARLDIGVVIFFVLSGFLLYRPFVVAQFADAPPPPTGIFWLRRLVRIFPAYWCALGILLVLGTVSVSGATGLLTSFTLTQVYSPTHVLDGITQSWSLATELGFYLLLPSIALAARRLSRGRDGRSTNRQALLLLACCGGLAAVSVTFRVVMARVSPYGEESWGAISRLWTPSFLDIFGAGMALAVISAWSEQRSLIRIAADGATRRVWTWWLAGAFVFWFVASQFGLARGLNVAGPGQEIVRQTLYGVVALLFIVPIVFRRAEPSLGLRLLSSGPVVWLGLVSYGIYLWHQAALTWAHDLFGWPVFSGNIIVLVVFAVVVSAVIAGISHRFVEDPVSRLVRRRHQPGGR